MIAHLNGTPVASGDRWVILDVNDVGYKVFVPDPAVRQIAHSSGKIKVYTYMAVREDAISLYGFLHESELELFTILISVSGIGPQIALNILSQISLEDFVLAIVSGDEKSLVRIPGIGKKSAQRLILELRDKMKKVQISLGTSTPASQSTVIQDAISALVSLGFSETASVEAVRFAVRGQNEPSIQEIIKSSLRHLKEEGLR